MVRTHQRHHQDFSKGRGSHCVKQRVLTRLSCRLPCPVLLKKGDHGHPRTPPHSYALAHSFSSLPDTQKLAVVSLFFPWLKAKAGLGMNLLAVIVLVICVNTYGVPMFDLHNFPDWAESIGPISSTAATPTPSGNFTLLCLNFTSS